MLFRRRGENDREDGGTVPHFDRATSDRTLSSCAGILSWCDTAITESTRAASPFLSVQQKADIQATATNFESRRQAAGLGLALPPPPAPSTAAPQTPAVDLPSREEIEAMVNHRVDIAVQEALKNLGIPSDASLSREIEQQVEVQLATQEHRLLEYVKHQLTESLEVLESSLTDRIAELAEGRSPEQDLAEAKAEVDAQVEEAREALLRHIDEVRTVDVGFNIDSFAAELAGMADMSASPTVQEVELDDEEEIVAAGEADEDELEEIGLDTESGTFVPAPVTEAASTTEPAESSASDHDDVEPEIEEEPEAGIGETELVMPAQVAEASEVQPIPEIEGDSEEEEVEESSETAPLSALEQDEDEVEAEAEVPQEEESAPDEDEAIAQVVVELTQESEPVDDSPDSSADSELADPGMDIEIEQGPERIATEHGITLDLDDDILLSAESEALDTKNAVEHYLDEGQQHLDRGEFREAVASYDSCLRVDEDLAMAYFKRASAWDGLDEHRKAFLDLMRARDLDAELPDIRRLLSDARKKVNKAAKAKK